MKKTIIITLVLLLSYSCQTYRSIVPKIYGATRQCLILNNPIIISFKDSRKTIKNSLQIIESLQNGLKSVYGNNIIFKPHADKIDDNSVAIKINIKEIGSNFGFRSILHQTNYNQINIDSISLLKYWGKGVLNALPSQPIIHNNAAAKGYWFGTSCIEIAFIDNLYSNNKIYEFSFVGDDKQKNTLGYKSGNIAAENSWNIVSSNLLVLLDSITIKIMENK
jgi:hypothetical protein